VTLCAVAGYGQHPSRRYASSSGLGALRLEAARAEVDTARRVLAGLASEALAAWPVHP
jgi:hypothetical protein